MTTQNQTMKNTGRAERIPLGIIASPGFITALVLLLVNDHVLKYQFPGLITGKLSDFSGLFVVGLLALSLRRVPATISLTLLALLFVWWKSPASSVFIALWNDHIPWPVRRVVDYSDLLALVSLPAAHSYWLRHRTIALSRLLRIPLIVATVFGVTATSLPYYHVKLEVPEPIPSKEITATASEPADNVKLLRDLDEVIRTVGYLPLKPREDVKESAGRCTANTVELHAYENGNSAFLTVEYDTRKQLAILSVEDNDYEFRRGSELLRRTLRDALVQHGYFPLEGGVLVHQPPTTYTRMLITTAPDVDPLNSAYAYDFRRLNFKANEVLTRLGFSNVARADCGNNAYFAPERICYQYLAGQGAGDGGEVALTSVSLVGYMFHGQPPIEVSIVQFGANAPYTAPALARKLQTELQTAIPELAINVVTELDAKK